MTGENTYTGRTIIYNGTLALGMGGSLSASSSFTLTDTGRLDITGSGSDQTINTLSGTAGAQVLLGGHNLILNQTADATFAGVINGAGGLIKNGTNIQSLTGDNTYTGDTVVNAGSLGIGNGGTTGSIAGNLVNNATVTFNRSNGSTYGGAISGTGHLYKQGAGSLTLTGAHAYTGTTSIYAGTLAVGMGGLLSASSMIRLDGTGRLDISGSGSDQTITALAGGAGTQVLLGGHNLIINPPFNTSFAGVMSGAGGLIKNGTGTLTLTGDNTYTGDTVVSAGTLFIGNGGTTGSIAGNIVNNAEVYIDRSDDSTYSGAISGTGILIKQGAGTLTLTGAHANTGFTYIDGGTLAVGMGGSLSASSTILLNGSGRLDISGSGSDQSIVTLGGAAGTQVLLGGHNLILDPMHSGTFTGVISGAGGLIKNGLSSQVLTGENIYTGDTVVNAGSLVIGNGGTTGSLAGNLINNGYVVFSRRNNSTYSGAISGTGTLTKQGAGTLTLTGAHTYTGDTEVRSGGLIFASSPNSTMGNITVAGGRMLGFAASQPVNFTGRVDLQDNSTLNIFANSGLAAFNADTMNIGAGTTFNLSGINDLSMLPMTLFTTTGGITGDFANVSVGGFAGTVDYMTVHTRKSSDNRSYVADYGLSWIAGNSVAHGTFTLTDAANSFTVGGSLADQSANAATGWNGTSLTKNGAGTLILTADNTYTGGTTIAGGTLKLGHQTSTGSVLGSIVNNGTLWIDRTGAYSFANTVSGTGGLIYSGGGTLALTGTNTYAGGTLVTAGTVSVSNDANLGAASGTITLDGGTLQVNGSAIGNLSRSITLGANGGGLDVADNGHTLIVSADISGGDLTKRGEGKLALTGNNTYGNTIIEQGTLSGALSSIRGDINVASAARLEMSHSGPNTFDRLLRGAGSFNLYGTGTTLLTSDSSGFTGNSFLHAGTLLVGQDAAARLGGSLNVSSGATLGGSGTIGSGAGSVVSIGTGATLSPGNSIGTLTIDGDLVLSAGSFLTMELGSSAGTIGGASTNDRVDVTGDLTLAGTLNLTESVNSTDGTAGFGYYRLATYGGALTNNGLSIGTTPTLSGADYQILTTSAGAVDLLIASIGDQTLQHWQGGNGVWNAASTQWLNRDGQVAVGWAGEHAVFRNLPGATNGGIITVEGAQSFKGLQFVDEGYSLDGTGTLVTHVDGSEIRVLANSASIATAISGTGGLTKTQAGTLVLTRANSYSGGTTVLGGSVSVSSDDNLGAAGTGVTLNGGSLQVTGTGFGTLSRAFSIGSNGGAIDVADASHTLTVASAITGGDLIKRGDGTLVLSGANAYGNTSVERGTLAGTLSNIGGNISLANGTTLNLTQGVDFAYAGAFSGQGNIILGGNGTTSLLGDSSAFNGTTQLNGGTLLLGDAQTAGRLGGSLHIASGATLGGSGTIGSGIGSLLTIGAGAPLSPGNSIGTLAINGDLKFDDGSRFVVEVNPRGTDSDRLYVSGSATLNGGTVAHIGATGNYNTRSTYTILAAGSLTGAFGAVTSDFAFLNPNLLYDYAAGTVQLELVRNDRDFAAVAQTHNQIATANAIESIGYTAGHGVYDAVVQLADDADAIRSSYDQLSGELHGAVRSVQILDSRFVRDAANDRLRSAFGQAASGEDSVMAYASNGAQVMVDATHEGPVFWAQSHGSWGTFDTDAATFSMDRQIGGAMLGGDISASRWRVGLLGGYSHTEVREARQQAVSDNTTLGAYAGARWGKAGVRVGLAQTWHDIETDRSVIMPGLIGTLEADYDGSSRQIFVEGDYALLVHQSSRLEAYANLAQVRSQTHAFAETGGAAALGSIKSTHEVLFTTLGLRAAHEITLGQGAGRLRASAGWRHASGDTSVEGTHAFSAGKAFNLNGAAIPENVAVVDAGMDVRFNARTTFSLNYIGQYSSGAHDHGFNARMSLSF